MDNRDGSRDSAAQAHRFFRLKTAAPCAWLKNRTNLLFLALIALHLVPIWSLTYFPTQDGPSHLHNAAVIREYSRPEYSVFRKYYVLNDHFEPAWLGHLALAGLSGLVPVLVAEKILLSLYVLLFPVSMYYALRAVRPRSGFLAVLAFPFIYNFPFNMGFYSFSLSLPLCFFVIGHWLKHRERFTLRQVAELAGLTFLLYCAHPVSLVVAWFAIGFLGLWLTGADLLPRLRAHDMDQHNGWLLVRSRIFLPLCALLPTLIFVTTFIAKREMARFSFPSSATLLRRFIGLASIESLVSYSSTEILLSLLFAAQILFLVRLKLIGRRVNRWDGLLLVCAVCVVIYLSVPDFLIAGGAISHEYVSERMNLYPFLVLILWFGAQSYGRQLKRTIQVVASLFTLALLLVRGGEWIRLNDYLKEYASGMALIEPNRTVLPLSFSAQPDMQTDRGASMRVLPFLHAFGYIAAQRHVVDLGNYEAATDFFPIRFRLGLNPYTHIGQGIESQPPAVTFLDYSERTGGSIDYILIWGLRQDQCELENTKSVFHQLEAGYDLIYTSPQRGLTQLYRRKNWQSVVTQSHLQPRTADQHQ